MGTAATLTAYLPTPFHSPQTRPRGYLPTPARPHTVTIPTPFNGSRAVRSTVEEWTSRFSHIPHTITLIPPDSQIFTPDLHMPPHGQAHRTCSGCSGRTAIHRRELSCGRSALRRRPNSGGHAAHPSVHVHLPKECHWMVSKHNIIYATYKQACREQADSSSMNSTGIRKYL